MRKRLIVVIFIFFLNIGVVNADVRTGYYGVDVEDTRNLGKPDITHYQISSNKSSAVQGSSHNSKKAYIYVYKEAGIYQFYYKYTINSARGKKNKHYHLYISKDKIKPDYTFEDDGVKVKLSKTFIKEILNNDEEVYKKKGYNVYTKTDGDGSFIFGATPDDFSKEDINKPDLKADKGNAKPGKTTEEPEIHRSGDEEPLTEKELNELLIPTEKTCSSLLGLKNNSSDPAYYISVAFNILKYAAILFLIIFSMADYFKAVISKDEDALNKATRNSIKRLIYCIIIFVLPTLVLYLFEISGVMSDPKLCGIQ